MTDFLAITCGPRLQAMIDRVVLLVEAAGWWYVVPPIERIVSGMRSLLVGSEPLIDSKRAAFVICAIRCQKVALWDMSEFAFDCNVGGNKHSLSWIDRRTCCKPSEIPVMLDGVLSPAFDEKMLAALKRHLPDPTPKHWVPKKVGGAQ